MSLVGFVGVIRVLDTLYLFLNKDDVGVGTREENDRNDDIRLFGTGADDAGADDAGTDDVHRAVRGGRRGKSHRVRDFTGADHDAPVRRRRGIFQVQRVSRVE